jgi:hypothetical protein
MPTADWQTGPRPPALHITVLHHGFYVGEISIWGGLARPNGRASKHDQMSIEFNTRLRVAHSSTATQPTIHTANPIKT